MKKIIFGLTLLTIMSSNAFSYEGGFLKRNCISADINPYNSEALTALKKEVSNKQVELKILSTSAEKGMADIHVIVMGKNGALKLDSHKKPYFSLNKGLESLWDNQDLKNLGINFILATSGECSRNF